LKNLKKEFVGKKIAGIPSEMLRRTVGDMRGRLQECLHRDGGHLEVIIFKK
jgi:hypothetical protein